MVISDIIKATGLTRGGTLTTKLHELESSGFIKFIPAFGKKKKGGKYRLVDEYTLFYLTWVKEIIGKHAAELSTQYWLRQHASQKYRIWSGFAFENLCFKHLDKIIEKLGLRVVAESATMWMSDKKEKDKIQIDLVIDRADRCVTLCEMRFYDGEYVMDKAYAEKLQHKKRVFKEQTQTRKTLFVALITNYGAKENMHYLSVVNEQVCLEDLF